MSSNKLLYEFSIVTRKRVTIPLTLIPMLSKRKNKWLKGDWRIWEVDATFIYTNSSRAKLGIFSSLSANLMKRTKISPSPSFFLMKKSRTNKIIWQPIKSRNRWSSWHRSWKQCSYLTQNKSKIKSITILDSRRFQIACGAMCLLWTLLTTIWCRIARSSIRLMTTLRSSIIFKTPLFLFKST